MTFEQAYPGVWGLFANPDFKPYGPLVYFSAEPRNPEAWSHLEVVVQMAEFENSDPT
jgi:hypothetical protein